MQNLHVEELEDTLENIKRPFGNSDIAGDIAEMLGVDIIPDENEDMIESQHEELMRLYYDLPRAIVELANRYAEHFAILDHEKTE